VIGEVKNPGEKTVPARTPLNKAILIAGGLEEWRAQGKRVELIRLNRNGSAIRRVYRMSNEEGISAETNPSLRDGDTIIVNRNQYAKTADAIGAVSQPLSGLVNILALIRIIGNTD
jgi:polysaccharide export outer membrane protein